MATLHLLCTDLQLNGELLLPGPFSAPSWRHDNHDPQHQPSTNVEGRIPPASVTVSLLDIASRMANEPTNHGSDRPVLMKGSSGDQPNAKIVAGSECISPGLFHRLKIDTRGCATTKSAGTR